MSEHISKTKLLEYFDDLEKTLKDQVIHTNFTDTEGREKFYLMYHATQLLKARVLQDFKVEYTPTAHYYDEQEQQ